LPKNFNFTQSLSDLKIFDKRGRLFLKKIINAFRRLNKPRGGSPALMARDNALCRANADIVATCLYPKTVRETFCRKGMRILFIIIIY
jgi:hypothetical protein